MKKRLEILLTGAAGTIGSDVIPQVVKNSNYNLTVFDVKSNHSQKVFEPNKNRLNIIYGDISKPEDVEKLPGNIDVVIHLAAIIPPMSDRNKDLTRRVNVEGTRNLIRFLESRSPNAFLLFSSSVAVYGDRILTPLISVSDTLGLDTADYYALTKIESERLIRNSKLRWSIFRLTAIMKNHKISKLMFHMPLSTQFEICTPLDTARAFVKAIQNRNKIEGRVFNLGGGSTCYTTYREFLEESFRIYGLGKLNFPEHAFAERNFHCGIFADGDELNNLLNFRSDTLVNYFTKTKQSVPVTTRIFCQLFKYPIKLFLLNQSEPYIAFKKGNRKQKERFFFFDELKIQGKKKELVSAT